MLDRPGINYQRLQHHLLLEAVIIPTVNYIKIEGA